MNFASEGGKLLTHAPAQIVLTILVVCILQLVVRESIGRIVRKLVKSHKYESKVEERKREDTLISIFRTANAATLWLVAVVVILSELGINITALVTGAGLVGVVVGLGAQNVIKDYLAGLFIIIENQYRVGDVVTLDGLGVPDGASGVVEDISIRITKLRDLDGNLHFVRNGLAAVITNRTFEYAGVNIDIGVSYTSDVNKVEKVINETGQALAEDEAWRDFVLEPVRFVRVDSFGPSAVVVKSVGKVRPGNQWNVAGEFRRRIMKAFEAASIEIALPQLVVHEKSSRKG